MIILVIFLLAILVLLILATIGISWPKFHPGWAALFLAALYYALQRLAGL